MSPSRSSRRTRPVVVVACPGAGIVNRGYETFAIDLARRLQGRGDMTTVLLSGGPLPGDWVVRVPTLSRTGRGARSIARRLGVQPALVEQMSFATASLPRLRSLSPDTVILSERALGAVYTRLRPLGPGSHARLVLSNGGGSPPPYSGYDLVQHLTPFDRERATSAGEPPEKHVCLPYAFDPPPSRAERSRFPSARGRAVVLSMGSLDASRKRMDHVITAVSRLRPVPYLALVGPRGDETPAIESLALDLLGEGNFELASVAPDEIGSCYDSADVFVLASTEESFGRVYVEALMHGLPCIAHDFPVARYVLGIDGTFVDMTAPAELTDALQNLLGEGGRTSSGASEAGGRRERAAARFSWEALLDEYVALLGGGPGGAVTASGERPRPRR